MGFNHVFVRISVLVWCILTRVTLISFCQLDTNLGVHGKKALSLRNCPPCVSLWACLWGIFLIANWCRRSWPPVSSATPGSWSWVQRESKKQARKQLPSTGSVSSSCLESFFLASLTDGLLPGSVSWNKPLFLQVAFGHGVYHNRELTKTVTEDNQM